MTHNLPSDARVFPLAEGRKTPLQGSHAHLKPTAIEDFDFTLVPKFANYGVALDGKFCVVDVDDEEVFRVFCEQTGYSIPEGAWTQKTRRGHHYLFRHEDGGKNLRLPGADVKVNGYIVGPGSIVAGHLYESVGGSLSVGSAPWLRAEIAKGTYATPETHTSPAEEIDGIPSGEHDAFLTSIAGFARRRGLSEDAIRLLLEGGPLAVLRDTDPERPYTDRDIARIAHSVGKYEAVGSPEIADGEIEWGDESKIIGPVKRWWMHGFIPQGELVMINGKGSAGKSTFASYVASRVVVKGGRVLRIGSEEPFHRYLSRVYLANANPSLVGNLTNPHTIRLPESASLLRKLILDNKIDLLYFDSIMDHFASPDNLNAAERARACLSPLAAIAIETGCTILCTFHENKGGKFMGSTEMENVGRIRLSITKAGGKSIVAVEKTNFQEPTYRMLLTGEMVVPSNPDGQVTLEEDEDGKLVPTEVFVVDGFAKVGAQEMGTNDYNEALRAVAVAQAEKLQAYKAANPGTSYREIGRVFGCSEKTVQRAFRRG